MESIAGFPEGRALLPSELGFRRWGLLPRDLLLSALLPTPPSEKCGERRRQGAESTFSRWQRLIRVWTRGPSPRAALPCPPPGRAQGLPGAEVPEGREGGSEQVLLTAEGRGGTEPVLSSHHRSAQRVPLKRKTETGSKNVAPTPNTGPWRRGQRRREVGAARGASFSGPRDAVTWAVGHLPVPRSAPRAPETRAQGTVISDLPSSPAPPEKQGPVGEWPLLTVTPGVTEGSPSSTRTLLPCGSPLTRRAEVESRWKGEKWDEL